MAWQKRNMFSSAVDMQRGGAVPWPGYFTGGQIRPTRSEIMPMQLFEEGDQDINMALNNLESTTNPSIEQIKDTEAVSIGPSMEQEMTMDQGLDSITIKEKYQNIARQYATNLAEEGGDMNLFMKQVKEIEIAYANELEKMGEGMTPENQLMTPEFVEEIQMIFVGDIPEMVPGGVVPGTMTKEEAAEQIEALGYGNRFTPEMWIGLPEEDREKWTRLAPAINTRSGVNENEMIMTRLNELLDQRQKLAPQMGYAEPTKQGGILGFATQYNKSKALQAEAKDAMLEDAMSTLRYGTGSTSGKSGTIPAAVISDLYGINNLSKLYKEHMGLQSKGVEGQFDVFSEIPGFIDLYGQLPPEIEESYNLGGTKIVQGASETFYDFFRTHKNITINAWNNLPVKGTIGEFMKRSSNTAVPQKLIWTRAVEAWNSIP